MPRRFVLCGSLLVLLLMPSHILSAGPATQPTTYSPAFSELYQFLADNYPCFDLKQIDWKAVGDELLPRANDVLSDEAFGKLCLELVARLEDSHAQLLPAKAAIPEIEFPQWDPGFACLIDDRGEVVVFHVDLNSPADLAGVRVGMAVISINGVSAKDAMNAWMTLARKYTGYSSERYLRYDAARMFMRQLVRGAKVRIVMQDIEGAERGMQLPATCGVRYIPRLPVPIDGINDAADVSWKKLDDHTGYIYVRRIGQRLIESLDEAVAELKDLPSLIIDVRGNSGGGFDASRAFRNFDPADPDEPQRPRFNGNIAILIDERCISAGEGWTSWFVANHRAKLYGATTAGASSRKQQYEMSNGLYSVIVPVKAYTGFLDRPIERRGIEPDVEIRANARDLGRRRDTVLERARADLRALSAQNVR